MGDKPDDNRSILPQEIQEVIDKILTDGDKGVTLEEMNSLFVFTYDKLIEMYKEHGISEIFQIRDYYRERNDLLAFFHERHGSDYDFGPNDFHKPYSRRPFPTPGVNEKSKGRKVRLFRALVEPLINLENRPADPMERAQNEAVLVGIKLSALEHLLYNVLILQEERPLSEYGDGTVIKTQYDEPDTVVGPIEQILRHARDIQSVYSDDHVHPYRCDRLHLYRSISYKFGA